MQKLQIAEQSRPRKLIKNFGLSENIVFSRCQNFGNFFLFYFKHSVLQNVENIVRLKALYTIFIQH